jgi:hypothetical protein
VVNFLNKQAKILGEKVFSYVIAKATSNSNFSLAVINMSCLRPYPWTSVEGKN